METRTINRYVASMVILVSVTVSGFFMGRTLGLFRPTGDELLPLTLRFTVVFFTFESVRMFVHVVVGTSFYRPAPPLDDGFNPLVSVVVPAWNEEVGLAKTIESVLASDYKNLEIIVVNDGSTDGTQRVAELYAALHPTKVYVRNQDNGGKGSALNSGVAFSLGEIVVNVDADSAVHPDAIGNLVRPFAAGGVDAVVGRIDVGNTKRFLGRAQAFEYMFGFHLRRAQSVFNTVFILSGAMCAYTRKAFDATRGFRDYSKTEDMDFSMQLRANGCRLVYADNAVCVTEGAADLKGLRDQRTRWRYGSFACFFAHRTQFFDSRRGHRSLGFYELPFSLIGNLQILVFPLVAALAFLLPVYTGEYLYLVMILLSVPLSFAIVFWSAGTLRQYAKYLPGIIVLMAATMTIEHVTMWRSIRKHATGGTLTWTTWQRQGVDGSGHNRSDGTPSVSIPAAVMHAFTAGHLTAAQLDARLDAALDELIAGYPIASA